jgi:AraC-like DNA-binding protein
MHRSPARPWTLVALAREVGASRAVLARRFQDVVGESPMAFLTEWRLALAADLLCEPEAIVGSVAARVGYSTPYALSTAFKRVRGISPREHRPKCARGAARAVVTEAAHAGKRARTTDSFASART